MVECKGENWSHFNLHILFLDRAGHPRSSRQPRFWCHRGWPPWLLGYLFSYLFVFNGGGAGGAGPAPPLCSPILPTLPPLVVGPGLYSPLMVVRPVESLMMGMEDPSSVRGRRGTGESGTLPLLSELPGGVGSPLTLGWGCRCLYLGDRGEKGEQCGL